MSQSLVKVNAFGHNFFFFLLLLFLLFIHT